MQDQIDTQEQKMLKMKEKVKNLECEIEENKKIYANEQNARKIQINQ